MLIQFKRAFDARHEFEDEDIDVLKERWPNISFHNIPAAWIIPIDEMLGRLRYYNPITEIRQDYGQLIVIHGELKPNQEQIIQLTEARIYSMDEDIRKLLEAG